MNIEKTVNAINGNPFKVYLAITGGGTSFVGDFLAYSGGSDTILGVTIPYSQKCFNEFLGWVPEKYASKEAAEGLALQSYIKANEYNPKNWGVFTCNLGIGVSASLTKGPDERDGRLNVAYISVVNDISVENYVFDLKGEDGRQNQETLLSKLILYVLSKNTTNEVHTFRELKEYEKIYVSNSEYLVDSVPREIYKYAEIVFPGSFNPFHHGHKTILEDVKRITNKRVVCEISLTNVDKRPILPSEKAEREELFEMSDTDGQILIFVNAPKFNDKIKLYPEGTTFVVGADTFERILSLSYDYFDDLYNWVYVYDAKFIVIPRDGSDWQSIVQNFVDSHGTEQWYGSYEQLGIKGMISQYQEKIDDGKWPVNVSSTQIRNGELVNE